MGSSPHMRGILATPRRPKVLGGIIPAHAGHTCRCPSRCSSRWDHPRTCGAYESWIAEEMAGEGSSPHMRGIPRLDYLRDLHPGIIPAHAGHTAVSAQFYDSFGDHPRTCGAYWKWASMKRTGLGSSPHMRGIRRPTAILLISLGIIPAHAGHTRGKS